MISFENFKEELSTKEKFYSSLTDKEIGSKEYEHVLNVWNTFKMKTIKYYHSLYLKYDVLLLPDVFEKFRNNSFKNYGLCPSHYLSAPALSRNVMLNMKKGELEIISDVDMYSFFEKGMRGEISYISIRYSKANNKN